MNIRLTQLDGKLPNLALMKLAAWHREQGRAVTFTKSIERDLFEPQYSRVYASAIFTQSAERIRRFKEVWPGAIVGGTGSDSWRTVEDEIGGDFEKYDYSIYPQFRASIGFTQRGCRLKCGFCVVPRKEGKPRSVNSIKNIWRGEPYPRHLHLLDNDFFGQPEWRERVQEMRDGHFKVCLNQGINARMITDEAAQALASLDYRDDQFKTKRLYTAWDNIGDESRFMRGVETLAQSGIPPHHLMVYMLVGYDKRETWARLFYRFNKMVNLGIKPYPMVFGDRSKGLPLGGHNEPVGNKTLGEFQRWVLRRSYRFIPFADYDVNIRQLPDARQSQLFEHATKAAK